LNLEQEGGMTPRYFDPNQLEKVLRDFWDRETSTSLREPSASGSGDGEGDVFDLLPEMSSHEAVKVLLDLRPILGAKINKCLIRRGGYSDCEDFVFHLMERIQEELGVAGTKIDGLSEIGGRNARRAS
jgi:hypothetical protein